MKMKHILALVAISALGTPALAQTLFEDDFEAYTTPAELNTIGNWDVPSGTFAISTAQNNTAAGTKSLLEAKGDATTRVTADFASTLVGAGDTLTITHYTFGENLGTNLFRSGLTLGAYDGGGWGDGNLEELIAFGWYHPNSPTNYCARVAFGGANWQDSGLAFTLNSWDKLTIDLTGGGNFAFDVNDSGSPYTDTTSVTPTVGYNGVRLGSVLGFGTANDLDIYYDDLLIEFTAGASSVNDWHMF